MPAEPLSPTERLEELRASMIHGLRMQGWGKVEAENEADDRIERLHAQGDAS